MPKFFGQRVNRGHAPAYGGPKPPLPPDYRTKPFGTPPPLPPRQSGSASASPAPQGPQVNAQTQHNQWMGHHSQAIRDAQSTMKAYPRGSKEHREADLAVMSHRQKMDDRQKEWDSPMSVMKRAKAPKNG